MLKIHGNELILYRYFSENVWADMTYIANHYADEQADKEALIDKLYTCVNEIVTIAREHGFNGNLWHGYLTYLLTTNENAFSMSCEKKGAIAGSINDLALHDLEIFKQAYDVDWEDIERVLGVHFIRMIRSFQNPDSCGMIYSAGLRERIKALTEELSSATNVQTMYDALTAFYKEYGVGKFGLHRAFKIVSDGQTPEILPITRTENVVLEDIVGYELQKKKLRDNTEAFIQGKKANNVLLYGDSGTGKSTSIKAILNEYYKDGLRMIEVYKHQFKDISGVIAQIKNRNYKFILYMDDLSFEEFEIEYKYLKAIIEGGLETKPENVVIYATSNRRHLIRETWGDRKQAPDDVHGNDSMQEKLSLATRFGESIYYGKPDQKEYLNIARTLGKRYGIEMPVEMIEKEAVKWELGHGGRSGRTAQQFINHLIGITE